MAQPEVAQYHSDRNKGRRKATVKAMAKLLERNDGILYTDASLPTGSTSATIAVATLDKLICCASLVTPPSEEAEEVA